MCNHIIGIAITRVMNEDGSQRLEWKDEITAEHADWRGDGIVSLWWDGHKYSFCPLCGENLGSLSTGLRSI